jgi:hypothetical protein
MLKASLTSLASEVTQDPIVPYLMEIIFWAVGLGGGTQGRKEPRRLQG